MLVIRLQRTGRKKQVRYRLVIQNSRRSPTSGRVVAQAGHYDPHQKTPVVKKEIIRKYLDYGAQPSERVVKILLAAGIELPAWVKKPSDQKSKKTKNPEKLKKNRSTEKETAPADDSSTEAEAEVGPKESAETEASSAKPEVSSDQEKVEKLDEADQKEAQSDEANQKETESDEVGQKEAQSSEKKLNEQAKTGPAPVDAEQAKEETS